MSEHIEWSTLRDTNPSLDAPGEYVDGFGNENDHPALSLQSAVLEGPLGEWGPWALALFDSAREYAADEAGEAEPTPLPDLIAKARKALAVRGRDSARVIHLERELRALVDALDPEKED